jgi:hypothetical protein
MILVEKQLGARQTCDRCPAEIGRGGYVWQDQETRQRYCVECVKHWDRFGGVVLVQHEDHGGPSAFPFLDLNQLPNSERLPIVSQRLRCIKRPCCTNPWYHACRCACHRPDGAWHPRQVNPFVPGSHVA